MMLQDHSDALDAPSRRLRSRGRWPALVLAVAMLAALFTVSAPSQARADDWDWWWVGTNGFEVGPTPKGIATVLDLAVQAEYEMDFAKAYMANSGDGTVSVYAEASSGDPLVSITVGTNPVAVAAASDSTRVYVSSNGDNTVYAIDTVTDEVVAAYPVAGAPSGLAVSPDGATVYVALSDQNAVAALYLSTGASELIPVGSQPLAAAIAPDGLTAYVTNHASGTVSQIDTATKQVIRTIDLGGANPTGLAVSADSSTVYVVRQGALLKIEAATGDVEVLSTQVGNPQDVALSPFGSRLYVAETGWSVDNYHMVTEFSIDGTSRRAFAYVQGEPHSLAFNLDGLTLFATIPNPDDFPPGSGYLNTIDVHVGVSFDTTTLPDGKVGVPYHYQIPVTGTPAPRLDRGTALPGWMVVDYDTYTITGTPTVAGTSASFALTLQNSSSYPNVNSVGQWFTVTVSGAPTIDTESLPDAVKGVAYSQQLEAFGDPAPTFSVTSGALPTGLTLSAAGLLSGTPTGATATFEVTATNSEGTDEKTYTLTVNTVPSITTASLPDATTGVAYSQQLLATGDPAPTFSVTSGALPTGLSLSTAGLLSGTPTGAAATFEITATNTAGTDAKTYTLTVNATPTIATTTLPDAIKGSAYSQQLVATGDPAPNFSVTSGALPVGLSLSGSGLLSGTPTGATATFEVTATNTAGTDAKSYTLTVNTVPSITTASLPDATTGVAYSQQLVATGDPSPTFSVTSGTLPTGLSLSTAGLISGTPTGATASFEVTATNVAGTDAKSYTLTVNLPPPAKATGVTVEGGMQQAFVSWTPSADDPGSGFSYTVTILQHLNTFSCTTTGTWCVVTGLAAGPVTVSVIATGPTGPSSAETGTGTVLARTDAPSVPSPGPQGGASVEFRDRAGQVVTEIAPGQVLTVIAEGFAEGSLVDVFVYSAPQHLGSGVANASGTATFNVTVPKDLTAGAHTLVAFGLNGTGAAASASVKVRVTEPGDLSNTGSNDGWLLYGAALLLGSGVVLLRHARRRATVTVR